MAVHLTAISFPQVPEQRSTYLEQPVPAPLQIPTTLPLTWGLMRGRNGIAAIDYILIY